MPRTCSRGRKGRPRRRSRRWPGGGAASVFQSVPGAGAAGGLGGAFAALGAELVPGAPLVLDRIGFDPRGADLVVTGEGAVDETTWAGKATGEVVRRCREADVRCELFSARDDLSGDPTRAREDLFALGHALAGRGCR